MRSSNKTPALLRMLTSAYGRFCCKSRSALVKKNSAGCRRGFRVKMWGTSSPYAKLTGDFRNATEAIRIGDCVSSQVFAKNSAPCKFRLLQHNRHICYMADEVTNVC